MFHFSIEVVSKPTYILAKNKSHAMPQCYSLHIPFDLLTTGIFFCI